VPLRSLTRHLPAGHTLQGPAAALARALYDTLIESELAVERLLDALEPPPAVDERDLRRVTALVKTFERPDVVRRLVESMQRLYPAMPIIVVDDSRSPVALEGVRVVEIPFDSGIGAGRNKGLEQAETDFVLVLDDDFVLTRKTRLGSALALMERHPEIDFMGGQLVDLPFYFQAPIPRGQVFPPLRCRSARSAAPSAASRSSTRCRRSSSLDASDSRRSAGIRSGSAWITQTSSRARSECSRRS